VKTSFLILLSLTVFPLCGGSQAVMSSLMEVKGLQLYEDIKDADKFYYAPGKLQLHHNEDGQPTFKLIEMRYTGTGLTGNQGEKRFMNIVQFRVIMKKHENSLLAEVKKSLSRKAKLRPLPLNEVQANLVAPFEGTYKAIGNGVFDTTDKAGKGSKKQYWTERVFTARLENHEAQLLWDMVEKGQLAMSLSYSYFADIINDEIIDFDSESDSLSRVISKTVEEIKSRDTIVSPTLIQSDAFSLDIDYEKYPETLVKKDLNGSVPAAYPALQVSCYDFYNELRPDLAMKTVEFQVTGLNNNLIKLRPMKFVSASKDLYSLQVRFPFAANMNKPLRYKIKEYSHEGDIIDKGWVTLDSWIGILDITSQTDDIKVSRRHLEIEADIESMEKSGIIKYDVILEYQFLDNWYQSTVSFNATDAIPIKPITILSNVDNNISYKIIKTTEERRFSTMKRNVAIDDYIYINMDTK